MPRLFPLNNISTKKVPFLSFSYTNSIIEAEIKQAFERVFKSDWYIMGRELKQFEEAYAKFGKTKHCIGVGNGLDALNIALKALALVPGDEIIVPSNTYIATWLAISLPGATIVPVESNKASYNIDPEKIEAAIGPKTKGIMPVHLYGQACEMGPIMTIAQKHELFVVEDNAQAQGASYNGQMTGSFGDINATSFYPTKNLGAFGDAGAITTNDDALFEKAMMLRNYGSEKKYHNEMIGFNSRLDEMQAAFLTVKLNYLESWTSERRKIAKIYNTELTGIEELILPATALKADHVYHLYVIRTAKREKLIQHLDSCGISTAIHYPIAPHLQQAYKHLNYKKGHFPIAEELAETSLSLPLYPGMTDDEIQYIIQSVRSFYA